jgi:hypothetical protein
VRFRQVLALGEAVTSRTKLAIYGRTVATQWLLAALMLLILRRHGLSAADAGERLGDAGLTLGGTLALLVVLAVASWFVLRRVRRMKPAALAVSVGRLRGLAPVSGPEMEAFVAVCLTAGVCEEWLYRLAGEHSVGGDRLSLGRGRGRRNRVRGGARISGRQGNAAHGFIGLQLAILYVFVGSLIPGQVLHAGVDLLAGVAGALAVSRLREAEAEPPAGTPGGTPAPA